jgi:hypothetical protein
MSYIYLNSNKKTCLKQIATLNSHIKLSWIYLYYSLDNRFKKPSIKGVYPFNVSVDEGSSVMFECIVASDGQPNIQVCFHLFA